MATGQKTERQILPEPTRDQVVSHLQENLANLSDLALQGKQAHWNLLGRRFFPFHEQLDLIVDSARKASDDVAERIAALGTWADGRADAIASQTSLERFPDGRQSVEAAVTLIADRLETTVQHLRQSIDALDDLDLVSQDLLIGVAADLEKHLWMVQSQEE
jgi:starvation-inducible DNA-binding protein